MSVESWPWWLGALALATCVLGLLITADRAFGASGFWSRALGFKAERELKKAEEVFGGDAEAFQKALLEATLQEFGPMPVPGGAEETESEPARPPADSIAPLDETPEAPEEERALSPITTAKKKKRRTKAGLKTPKKKHKKKPGNRRSAKRKR